nr:hypothetical protein [Patescibacteria group bacterium]
MLYLIYGNDTHKARKKLHELLELAQKKRPGSEIFKVTSENWSEGQLDELIVSQGLFEQKYTIVLDSLFEKKDIKDYVVERLEEINASEQIFLMLEANIDALSLKKIEKNSKQVQLFAKNDVKKSGYNIFAIADGLRDRDKKSLWISYVDFLNKGSA